MQSEGVEPAAAAEEHTMLEPLQLRPHLKRVQQRKFHVHTGDKDVNVKPGTREEETKRERKKSFHFT